MRGIASIVPITLSAMLTVTVIACEAREPRGFVHIGPDDLPTESYVHPPAIPPSRSDYVIKLENMSSFYDVPGEAGYFMDGADHGFDSLSFILTETHPHGGPPLHTHETEEAHVIYRGRMAYIVGNRRFEAVGPFIARIPAGAEHTFVNTGDQPLNLTAVFPSGRLSYREIGPNPLIAGSN
jgi:mannose-6-phosphate isomerase-like protein (cupin superfamily)